MVRAIAKIWEVTRSAYMSQKAFIKEVTFEQGLERQLGFVLVKKVILGKGKACVMRGAYARGRVWASARSAMWQEPVRCRMQQEELLRTTLKC